MSPTRSPWLVRWSEALGVLGAILTGALLLAAFFFAPEERTLGISQKIFYIHVPAAISTYVCVGIAGLGSALYLVRRHPGWDATAVAAVEVGLVFGAIVLVTGPLWARPVWNKWWTWDPRLTSMLLLWLILVAYRLVRSLSEGSAGARFAAVLALFAVVDIPFIRVSTEKFRGMHPGNPMKAGLSTEMHVTLLLGIVAFTVVMLHFMGKRLAIETLRRSRLEEEARR